ncbi:carbon-nitrogen hydrolase family protein [Advenella alkanexedens]|uniref:Carbon-nitrogen hydrolase family protein n=1 Tax=Advenella alkanexedens TaxID=1481665 RepID=A0ABS6NP81_9BURK|nr:MULTISPECIES: carbon-nitrogen hydrolase family protein [Advenella]MBV4397447.1 carbon-nitrogen hydrolase family protein [Advenella alkanexedens]
MNLASDFSRLKVAVAQFPAVNDIAANKKYIHDLTLQAVAEGVELLVFPEAAMCSFGSDLPTLREIAQQHSPAFIEYMQGLARSHQMNIIVGVLSLSDDPAEERVTNRLLVMNAQGEVIVRYTKLHVYDAFNFKESDKVKPGDIKADGSELGLFKIKDFMIGLVNCYDLRFPELSRALAVKGADVISVSAAWIAGPYKENHWEILLRARAIENTSYVLASGQTAPRCAGNSMIIDPMGSIVAGCADQPGLAVKVLEKERIQQVRNILPCLENRRY